MKLNFHIPEGMQDILYESCDLKRSIENGLRELFRSYAYKEIETPALEFFEVFSTKEKAFPQEGMFKFFDEKGRVLVLKPDQTIPVARVASSKLTKAEEVSKVSYITNTYRFGDIGAGRQREYTHAGCELINASGSNADAEMITLAVNSMLSCGIDDFQIDIGQVGFFKGIMEESGLGESETEIVRELIDKKDYLGLEEILNSFDIKQELKTQIIDLPSYFGDIDLVCDLKKRTSNEKALEALDNIEQTYGILKDFGLDKYISVDLGMVQSINYYTGLIFKGYTYGVGFPILNGGRYDTLLDNFGTDMPAVGFSIIVNLLIMAVTRQGRQTEAITADTFVSFDRESAGDAYKIATALRKQGLMVEFDLFPGDMKRAEDYSQKRGIPGLVYVCSDGSIKILNNLNKEIDTTTFEELTGGGRT